jgi:hypothetical protein
VLSVSVLKYTISAGQIILLLCSTAVTNPVCCPLLAPISLMNMQITIPPINDKPTKTQKMN